MKQKLPYEPLRFDKKLHKYTDNNGGEYISVTTFISQHFPFNAQEIAEKVITLPHSKYYGMTVKDVLTKWRKSAPLGHTVHNGVEKYIMTGEISDNPEIKPLVEQFAKLQFTGTLYSEVVLHDEEFLIAGTADIIEENDDVCWLFDIKTSVASPKGDKLDKNKLHKFSIQTELYRRFAEKRFKKKCKTGGILWFKQYAEKREDTVLELVKVDDVTDVVEDLLQKRRMELIEKGFLS